MTVVVFNESAPDSEKLAKAYALKRGLAADHIIPLSCAVTEDISRADYERTIAEPLRAVFKKRGWWKVREGANQVENSQIRFVALMRGIPLRILSEANFPGDEHVGQPAIVEHNEASVDSELAALGLFTRVISGVLNNPYYRSFLPITEANLPAMLLVCRLDAPSPEIVQRMMDDSVAAEKKGLRGFTYVDARGILDGGYAEGDKWLLKIATDARNLGSPVILDNGPGLFPDGYPMRNAAFYFGWYTENISGPMARPDFRFPQGAVAVHIHSFSACTLRDPKRAWCAPLLAAGAAATMGNVFEPYLTLTPNLDIFHERLRAGFTFAESAWMSERVLSWMTTFIGDPLYRPFPQPADSPSRAPKDEWETYAAGAKTWLQNPETGKATLTASAQKMKSGVIMEGLGLLQLTTAHPEEAMASFAQARQFYKQPDDVVRASIHEILQLRGANKKAEALLLIRKQLKGYPSSPGASVLRMFETELDPPPPPLPAAATPEKPAVKKSVTRP
ncbi:MAG: hypothetical protein JWL90_710 [Chthoniobacteraceae bacterium]|nr:hypothetical protein [Chthoniobacteraceae bacterium]